MKSINGVAVTESKNWTTTNNVDGTFSFDRNTYTKAGTYVYEVYEDVPEGGHANGIHFSTEKYTVVVVIEDNLEGNLEVKSTEIENASKIVFTNVYSVTTGDSVTIEGTKDFTGRDWTDNDEFIFDLYEGAQPNIDTDTPIDSVTVNKDNVDFEFVLDYLPTDIGTYTYVLIERDGGKTINDIKYSDVKFIITVTVVDNGIGGVTATVTTTDANGDPVENVEFTNTYVAPLEPELGSMAENMWTMLFVIALLGIVATTVRRKEVEQN